MTGTKTSVDESEGSEQLGSKSVPASIGDGVQPYVVGRSDWDRGAGERPEAMAILPMAILPMAILPMAMLPMAMLPMAMLPMAMLPMAMLPMAILTRSVPESVAKALKRLCIRSA